MKALRLKFHKTRCGEWHATSEYGNFVIGRATAQWYCLLPGNIQIFAYRKRDLIDTCNLSFNGMERNK